MKHVIRNHIPWRALRTVLLLAIALSLFALPALAYAEDELDKSSKVTITISCNENGTVEPSGQIEIEPGVTQTIRITPNEGYEVGSVVRNGSQIQFNPEGGRYDLTNVQENQTIRVTFVEAKQTERPILPIEINCGIGGKISPSSGRVQQGDPFTFVCEAEEGYVIDKLMVDGVALAASQKTVFTHTIDCVEKPIVITATFQRTTYRIVVTATEGGVVSPAGTTNVEIGKGCSYTIVPNEGYLVKSALANGKTAGIDADGGVYHFINVNRDCTLDVVFEPIPTPTPTITPKPNNTSKDEDTDEKDESIAAFTLFCTDGGKVFAESSAQMPPAFNVEIGGSIKLLFAPDDGYQVAKLYVDGNDIGVKEYSGTLEFKDVQEGHKLVVQFKKADEPDSGATFEVLHIDKDFEYNSKEPAATPAPGNSSQPENTMSPEPTADTEAGNEQTNNQENASAIPIIGLVILLLAIAVLIMLWIKENAHFAEQSEREKPKKEESEDDQKQDNSDKI